MKIGKAIKAIRTEVGLSQGDLADKCKITQAALSQIESDKTKPSDDTLAKISEALGASVSLIYLMAIDINDVPSEKRELYDVIFPSLQRMAFTLLKVDK